jgi:hypothetical protein
MKPMIAVLQGNGNPVTVWTYLAYLGISIALTIWVARTLHKNGRVFLVDSFLGNERLADSVNHLLVVGFYLVNIGFVTLALRHGDQAGDAQAALEILSSKVGLVLVVLGIMHFFNLWVFSSWRRRAIHKQPPPLPQLHSKPAS